ncbi:MAG: C10 family peptidase [Planctomycetota bacterium]|jgi:hypothetical protein
MKKSIIKILVACVVSALISPVQAEMATMEEGLTVAENWIALIIEKKGGWGDANTAFVEDIQELTRDQRVVGYFCRVSPKGYIIISLRKELAPVKAYSATSDLDPECEEGMADLIKGCMERIIKKIEKEVGPIASAQGEDVSNILEINYRNTWDELEGDAVSLEQSLNSDVIAMDYQEGDWLLTSSWRQGDPYNEQCPPPPPGDDCTAPRCLVGCVATAGAQIMRHWSWPPSGVGSPYDDTYDWPNMPDRLTATSPAAQINAVAELCHEVGIAVGMNYCGGAGCQSGAITADMEGIFEDHYRYSTSCARLNRSDFGADFWFDLMKNQFNTNRPVQYRILGHSIVGDGWQEVFIGGVFTRQYHMNYGWDNNRNTWYTLDALFNPDPNGTTDDEYMVAGIFPAPSMGALLSSPEYNPVNLLLLGLTPYPYFDRDCASMVGHNHRFALLTLQFLPSVKLECAAPAGKIRFESQNRLFSVKGTTSAGIRIDLGAMELHPGGCLRFH